MSGEMTSFALQVIFPFIHLSVLSGAFCNVISSMPVLSVLCPL